MQTTPKPPSIFPIKAANSWGCKVVLPDKSRHSVSLRIPYPGNVREAEARARELQSDVNTRKLDQSLRWLGEKSAETLKFKLGLKKPDDSGSIVAPAKDPETWHEARLAWLATYPDRKTIAGKINDVDLTKKDYSHRTRVFCEWAERTGVSLKGKSATTVVLMYLRDRRTGRNKASAKGVSLGSLDHDLRVLFTWFGWLGRKGVRDQMDKDAVYDDPIFSEEDDAGENFIPPWKLDLATLTKMHETRFDSEASFSAWRLYVLVRGLGCRPKEAFTLSWDTCHIEEGVVVFRDVKEEKIRSSRRGKPGRSRRASRDRSVPIVYQWVQDALIEIKSLGAKRGTAVAINAEGGSHKGPAQASNAFGRHMKTIGFKRAGYGLKACQRAGIVHLEQVLPPWVVARIAGHSLGVHMDRYSTNSSHLPAERGRSYGRFDVLSLTGKEVVAKHQRGGLANELMGKDEL